MELPRDEMAFRQEYGPHVLDHSLTTVFRPGNRVFPNWRGYKPEEVVTARIIERVGSDAQAIPPRFSRHKVPVRIASIDVLDIADLRPSHFIGSAPDVFDRGSLEAHLFHIYGRPISDYGHEVTRIGLEYLLATDRVAASPARVRTDPPCCGGLFPC